MFNFILIHGYKGSPDNLFFPWLTKKLEEKGCKVISPELPDPAHPDHKKWTRKILNILPKNSKELSQTILIGHSLGAVAALKVLEKLPPKKKIKGVILIGAPFDKCGRDAIQNFFEKPLHFSKIQKQAKKIIVVISDDDHYVHMSHGEMYANYLQAELIIETNQKHFQNPNYPNLLNIIDKLLHA